jgi:hypothetical protein
MTNMYNPYHMPATRYDTTTYQPAPTPMSSPSLPSADFWIDKTTGLVSNKKTGRLFRVHDNVQYTVCEAAPVSTRELIGDGGLFCQSPLPPNGAVLRVYFDGGWCVATHRRSDAFKCNYVDREGHTFLFGADFAKVLTRKVAEANSKPPKYHEWKNMCSTLIPGFTYFYHLSYDENKLPHDVIFMYSRMHSMDSRSRILLPGVQRHLHMFEEYCAKNGIRTLPYSKDRENVITEHGFVVIDVLNGLFCQYNRDGSLKVEVEEKKGVVAEEEKGVSAEETDEVVVE